MGETSEIAVFVRVVEQGSFAGAASALRMPKTTVSLRVRTLEDRLGTRLLQRTTRRIALTEAGTAYYERCAPLLAALDEADAMVASMDGAPQGTLRITAPVAFSQRLLGPLLPVLIRTYPTLRVHLTADNAQPNPVHSNHDLAVRVGRPSDVELLSRALGHAPLALVASPRYLRERGVPRSVDALTNHALVVNAGGAREPTWRFRRGALERKILATGVLVSNDMEVVREALVNGVGVGLLPKFVCGADLLAKRLNVVLTAWSAPTVDIYAVYPSREHLSPKVRVAIDFLAEHVQTRIDV